MVLHLLKGRNYNEAPRLLGHPVQAFKVHQKLKLVHETNKTNSLFDEIAIEP